MATAATMAPMVKKTRATMTKGLRPKMCENDAKFGWKTVEVSKKDVPAQKASMAVPFSAWAMICRYQRCVLGGLSPADGIRELTGIATLRDVASRAATKVMRDRVRKAA